RIDDDRATDHGVELALGRRAIVLAHPRAEVLRVAPEHLIGGLGQVVFDPDPEVGIAQSHPVADRGSVSERVFLPGDAIRHPPSPRTAPGRRRGSRPGPIATNPRRGGPAGTR